LLKKSGFRLNRLHLQPTNPDCLNFTKVSNTPDFGACGLMLFGFGFCFGLLCGWLAGGYMDCVFAPPPYIGKPLKARPKKRNV
jgi:hypothetical protein